MLGMDVTVQRNLKAREQTRETFRRSFGNAVTQRQLRAGWDDRFHLGRMPVRSHSLLEEKPRSPQPVDRAQHVTFNISTDVRGPPFFDSFKAGDGHTWLNTNGRPSAYQRRPGTAPAAM